MLMILLISSFCFCNNGSVAITSNDGIVDGIVVHGGFSPSMLITGCSPTYGKGFQVFARACTNQSPKYGVKDCEGRRSFMMDYEVNDSIKNMKQQHGSHGKTSREDNKPKYIVREDIKPKNITYSEGFQICANSCTSPAPKDGGRECYCPRKETRFITLKSDADSEVKKHTTEDQRGGDVAKDTVQTFKQNLKNFAIHHQWAEWTSWSACPDGRSRSIRTRSSTKGYDKETRGCSLHKPEPKVSRPRERVHDQDRTQTKSTTRPPRVYFEDVPKPVKTFKNHPLWKAEKDNRTPIEATPKSSNMVATIGALVVGAVFLGASIFIYFKECQKLTKNHKTGKEKRRELRKKASVDRIENILTRLAKGLKGYLTPSHADPNADRTTSSRYENNNNATRTSKVPKSRKGKESSKKMAPRAADERRNFSDGKLFDTNESVMDEGNITSASVIAIRR